jgi:hypothetical protein
MVADLAGDPGGEAVTEAGEAQVDLAARERLPRFVLSWRAGAPMSSGAEQQLAHAPLPGSALGADHQQLGGGQPDGVGLGPDQIVARDELVASQRGGDLVGEPFGPAMATSTSEGDQLPRVAAASC